MTPAAPPSALLPPLLLLLLLLFFTCCLSGVSGLSVEAPAHYTALQGHLTAVVYLTPTPPPTDAPLYTWDFDNKSAILLNTSVTDPGGGKPDDPGQEDVPGQNNDPDDEAVRSWRLPGDINAPRIASGGLLGAAREPLTLSLFASGSVRAIKTYVVNEEVDTLSYIFECGIVVQGGIHFFWLQRGSEVLAVSGEVEVSWPNMTIEVPKRVETYRSPVEVKLRFTHSKCMPKSPIMFKTFVDLLYHGVPVGGTSTEAPPTTTPTTTPSWRQHGNKPWSFLKRKRSHRVPGSQKNMGGRKPGKDGRLGRKHRRTRKRKRRGRKDAYERYWEWIRRQRRAVVEDIPARGSVVSTGARAVSWAWGGEAVVLGRVRLWDLYNLPVHELRFPCEAIGPAGLYSVRLATDVHTSPVIAASKWFTVEWSDTFTLHVQAANIYPCEGSMGVHVTYPSCVGVADKVRVYARIRANVTSANPPTVDKYVSEQRVIKPRTSAAFPCSTFQQEATEYCFVYINTARTKAVSQVKRRCVPYYKPITMRKDGEWGGWSPWTECPSTCGVGPRLRHRFCDSPPPSNGGLFCQGDSIEAESCEGPACVLASQQPAPATTPSNERCSCGCTLALNSGFTTTISASAALCSGTAVWILQAPAGERVVAEVVWASLRHGAQWFKLRDGDSLSAPLLVRLPSATSPQHLGPSPRRLPNTSRCSSSGSTLLLEFRSDVNTSSVGGLNPASWGFLVVAFPSAERVAGGGDVGAGEAGPQGTFWGLLQGMHVAAVMFVVVLMVAVVVLAIYHWRRYRLYKRARLIPESPYSSLPGTPSKDRSDAASTLTLTEVISLKSLVLRPKLPKSLPLTRRRRSVSYSPLEREHHHEASQHSLPNSPFLTRRVSTPSTIRRSSSHLGRLLRRGSGTFKRRKRRFASVDELETRCISPIREMQREDEGDSGKEGQVEDTNTGEENSAKYREHRKSVLSEKTPMDPRSFPKLAKEKMNLERVRRSALSRSTSSATMRGASSVSDMSVNGTDTEMEYDYYDYDMDNASAIPGSLFGMDPLVLAWAPPFFLGPDDISPSDEGIPLNMLGLSEATPTAEEPPRPSVLSLQHLNIPRPESSPNTNSLQRSEKSDDSNDHSEMHDNKRIVLNGVKDASQEDDDDDLTPTTQSSKILNLDDIQFADDSDCEEENAL
ncbi:uncharacterized protein gogo isoform X2 [Procambarus clarkii]|uniref:uncharacterized protein gogo isoform X2 n=1 Tax=Procambarus clarkii TaxID=6728 RepID=UPI003743221E